MASFVFGLGIFAIVAVATSTGSPIVWTNSRNVEGKFNLKWNNADPEYLVMSMTAPGKGYVSVGFSPDGQMKDSDFVMGWVDEAGQAHIKDLYGIGNTKPREDNVTNVELIEGKETSEGTTIVFRRKWNTLDEEHDKNLNDNVEPVIIWAFNEKDPALADEDGVFRPPYHFTNRGQIMQVSLRNPSQKAHAHDDHQHSGENTKQ